MSRNDLTTSQLYIKQTEIEKEMVDLGVEKYYESVESAEQGGRGADTSYGQLLVAQLVQPIADALEKTVNRSRKTYIKPLKKVKLERAVIIALRAILTQLVDDTKNPRKLRNSVANTIGEAIQLELQMQSLNEVSPAYMKEVQASWKRKRANSISHKKNVINHIYNEKPDVEWTKWDNETKMGVGGLLLSAIYKYTDLIEEVCLKRSNRQTTYIQLSESANEFIAKNKDFRSRLQPFYRPMIVPPVEWGDRTKPYLTPAINSTYSFVRSKRGKLRGKYKTVAQSMYDTVNMAQSTPWRINLDVYYLLEKVKAIPNCTLVAHDSVVEKPPYPFTETKLIADCNEVEAAKLREWKEAVREIHTSQVANRANRRRLDMILDIAHRYKEYDDIYFPHSIDTRGRIYSIPTVLQPQGDDICKALLEFSEGQTLTDEGVTQLKLHIAGKYGLDKESHKDRLEWFASNEQRILAVASDPINHLEWLEEADKPFSVYSGIRDYWRWKNDPEAVIHARVNKDGACNGLQHFSMMLRDGDVGDSVNLTPSTSTDTPKSIYKVVANEVQTMLEQDVTSEYAQMWLSFWKQYGKEGTVDYKCMKRPVMTLPYSATMFSRLQYIKEYIRGLDKDAPKFFGKDYGKCTQYLAQTVTGAMDRRISSATLLLQWLTSACRDILEESDIVSWETPLGFEVFNRKHRSKTRPIPIQFEGKMVMYTMSEDDEKVIDTRGMASAIAPNFVHSMDACHMLKLVGRAVENNITSLHLVHDDYGCHANHGRLLADLAKEEFVRMYSENNVVQQFYERYKDVIKEEPPQEIGTLDISKIVDSLYAFD